MLGWMDEVFVLFAWVKVHAWIMYRLVYKWLHIEVSDCDIGFAVLRWNFVLNFQLSAIGPPKHGRTKEMDGCSHICLKIICNASLHFMNHWPLLSGC